MIFDCASRFSPSGLKLFNTVFDQRTIKRFARRRTFLLVEASHQLCVSGKYPFE